MRFFEKFGCLTTIIVIVGIIILCNKVDSLYYFTHEPVAYCKKFPSGKHHEAGLRKIIKKLNGSDGSYYLYKHFKTQKGLALFINSQPASMEKVILRGISEEEYRDIKRLAQKDIFTTSSVWDSRENSVEDKYKPEIAAIRADLESRWKNESYAWRIVNNTHVSIPSQEKQLLEQYLEYHPNGRHALDVNRMLVELLQDEIEELEFQLY